MVCVAIRLGDLVPVYPLSAILLGDSYFDPILVDTLDHPAIALERSSSNSNRLPYLQLLFFRSTTKACSWWLGC